MKDSEQMELIPSTSSQEDTPVSLSQSLDDKKLKRIRDISGQSILGLSKNSGQLGSLEKTLVDTLNSVSTPYSRTWRVKVTQQGRLVFQLRASVPTINGKGFGLLPTPTTQEIEHQNINLTKTGRRLSKDGKSSHSLNLADTVRVWRTPDAHSGRGASSKERMKMKLEKGMPISLNDQVAHPNLMWPTPRASAAMAEDIKNIQKRGTERGRLEERVALRWPTPTTNDSKNNGGASQLRSGRRGYGKNLNAVVAQRSQNGGSLNPTWVEWLMAYPKGWTDLSA